MAAFPSQFSLSVELTRLVPMIFTTGAVTYDAAVKLARELQNSGSDIVIEEDLAELFGRSVIEDNIASSFRNMMSQPSHLTLWHHDIGLHTGAGPTVLRALKETHYFVTLVQCSFLLAEHERAPLARVVARYFRDVAEDAPKNSVQRAAPTSGAVERSLQACEDQTASFDWRQYLLSIAALLGVAESRIHETIPPAILRGLLPMLPLSQRFPEDQFISIDAPQGVCSIVCWAHVLLGLSVVVYLNDDSESDWAVRFPTGDIDGSEQVTIDARLERSKWRDSPLEPRVASITLLKASTREKLFTLRADREEDAIDSTMKGRVRGLASRILDRAVPRKEQRDRVLREMQLWICGFSLHSARHLRMEPVLNTFNTVPGEEDIAEVALLPMQVTESNIFDACQLLFDEAEQASWRSRREYADSFAGKAYRSLNAPTSIDAILLGWGVIPTWTGANAWWPEIRFCALQLSYLVLAFANVVDLKACADAPLSEQLSLLGRSRLHMAHMDWDGSSGLDVAVDAWQEIISLMMLGETSSGLDLQQTSLLSNRGWSVFVTTFGDIDPYYVGSGAIKIAQGVPWRNDVWWHCVLDGMIPCQDSFTYPQEVRAGQRISLRCTSEVSYGKPLVGERNEQLLVALRLSSEHSGSTNSSNKISRRTGYNELWRALWTTARTKPCGHPAVLTQHIVLEPGWVALTGFGNGALKCDYGTLRICLTAHSIPARWQALLSILHIRKQDTRAMIRGPDCCLRCACAQASSQEGTVWYLIL